MTAAFLIKTRCSKKQTSELNQFLTAAGACDGLIWRNPIIMNKPLVNEISTPDASPVDRAPTDTLPVRRSVLIIERLALADDDATVPSIDRDARLIQNVAILREESRNGYRYSRAAMTQAVALFNGVRSFIDHGSRSVRDIAGRVSSLHLDEDALGLVVRGNLELAPGGIGDWLMDIADTMPDVVGLSIVARGRFDTDDKGPVVAELVSAASVDIVADPATTNGLFESSGETTDNDPGARLPEIPEFPIPDITSESTDSLTDWLACLLAERLGDRILDKRVLAELESSGDRESFVRRLIERLRLGAGADIVRSAPQRMPFALPEPDGWSDRLKEALVSR